MFPIPLIIPVVILRRNIIPPVEIRQEIIEAVDVIFFTVTLFKQLFIKHIYTTQNVGIEEHFICFRLCLAVITERLVDPPVKRFLVFFVEQQNKPISKP